MHRNESFVKKIFLELFNWKFTTLADRPRFNYKIYYSDSSLKNQYLLAIAALISAATTCPSEDPINLRTRIILYLQLNICWEEMVHFISACPCFVFRTGHHRMLFAIKIIFSTILTALFFIII